MPRPKLLYYDILEYDPKVLSLMKANFDVATLPNPEHDRDDILESIEIAMAPLGFRFGKEKIKRCPNLKIIASSTLSVPHIEVEYCRTKGIRVCYLGEERKFLQTITPTAELTWGLIIAITRRIPWAHKAVCSGHWGGRPFGKRTPRMLSNMTLGIVGLGRLGSMVASFGKPLVKEIYYYSPRSVNPDYKRCSTLLELALCSDIISIHAHHTSETEGLINKSFISTMKPNSYIVNTARGAIMDEDALLTGLRSGHLAGAALDVLADEYKPEFKSRLNENPLVQYARTHDNLIITPHYAGATLDAWSKTQTRTLDLILESLDDCT